MSFDVGAQDSAAPPWARVEARSVERSLAEAMGALDAAMSAVLHELRSSGPEGLTPDELRGRIGDAYVEAVNRLLWEGRVMWTPTWNPPARVQLTACQRALDEAEARAVGSAGWPGRVERLLGHITHLAEGLRARGAPVEKIDAVAPAALAQIDTIRASLTALGVRLSASEERAATLEFERDRARESDMSRAEVLWSLTAGLLDRGVRGPGRTPADRALAEIDGLQASLAEMGARLSAAEERAAKLGREVEIARRERSACWDALEHVRDAAVDLEPTLPGAIAALVRHANDERGARQGLRRAVSAMVGARALASFASAVEAAQAERPVAEERLRRGVAAIIADLGDDATFARVRHDLEDLLGAPSCVDCSEDLPRPANDGDELGADALVGVYDRAVASWPADGRSAAVLAVRDHVLRTAGRSLKSMIVNGWSVDGAYWAALSDASYVVGCALRAPQQPRRLSVRVLCPGGATQRGLVLADLDGWVSGSAHRWVLAIPETRARAFVAGDGRVLSAKGEPVPGVRLHDEDLRALRGEA